MKKSLLALLAVGIVLSLAATGCNPKGRKTVTNLGPGATGTGNTTNPGPGVEPGLVVPGNTNGATGTTINPNDLPNPKDLEGMTPDREIFKNQTVYFEFDKASVRPGEQSKGQTVAKVLKDRPNTKVLIEGHCDERGTEEYNRSLGEKRALALREYLMNLGIEGNRVFTVSFGEDKPAVQGHNDAAWDKNRRGEFILYSKP